MDNMGGKGSHRTCEICGAKERHSNHQCGSSLFAQFPLDENRCKTWLKAVGSEELVHVPIEKLHQLRHICGNHLKKKDFNKKGNLLRKRAIPMLNLTATPLTDAQLIGFPRHMHRSSNVAKREGSCAGSSKDQAKMSKNVAKMEEPCAGLSKDQALSSGANTSKNVSVLEEPEKNICTLSSDKAKTSRAEMPRYELTPTKGTYVPRQPEQGGKKRKLEESTELTPRKKKLIERLRKTKCTLRSLKDSAKIIDTIESPVLKDIVLNASQNQHRKPKGRRWTTQNKISALAIFKRSPKTYRYLQKIMPLPSEKTLQNILKKIPMQPGINKAVLDHLRNIAKDRDSKDNMCCLLFDEMALKSRLILNIATDIVEGYVDDGEELGRSQEQADHALVFMLQGLRQKYKQPVAFYFVKGTITSQKLAMIIKKNIIEISATGFQVLNTVCDQGPTNIGALKLLRELSGPMDDGSNHYFKVNDKNIYIVYDVPHLLKSVRNNFQKNGTISLNGKKAQWSHLKEVEQQNRNFLYLSKISATHVDPKYRAKMRVKYAAQILSTTVAAVLKLLSRCCEDKDPIHSQQLMESALVVQDLGHLFDITNGPSGHKDKKKGLRENVSQKTEHLNKWSDWIKKLSTLKFLNRNGNEAKNIKCVEGYITSLKSLRDIWKTLEGLGFKYFNLRQVNQDGLENLFGVIRQTSPTNRNPTCAHYMAAMKTSVITNLSAHHSRGSNCEEDEKKLLTNFHDLIFNEDEEPKTKQIDDLEQEQGCNDVEFPIISIPEEDLAIEDEITNGNQ